MRGLVAPHKPLLLLAIMDLIEDDIIQSPQIELNDALETAFKWNFECYAINITHFKPVIGTPFYHMSYEPFWNLVSKVPGITPNTTAVSTLRRHYKYAEIDQELFEQMKDPDARHHLREVLIKSYLNNIPAVHSSPKITTPEERSMIIFKGGLTIGGNSPIRINCNVGCNSIADIESELSKLKFIQSCNELPDMMMDLSLIELEKPLYFYIKNMLGLPFGTVLSYQSFTKSNGLQWVDVRDAFLRLCRDGVSFITVHFTADQDLFAQAKQIRKIPVTSRGGGMVLYDTEKNNRTQNIFREHLDEIIDIALKYDVVISLGSTFRPGTILDACDSVHIDETLRQLKICRQLQNKGVKVMVENIGHITMDKISNHSKLLKEFNAPIMPLGPLPTDAAINEDHIANAIGASFAAYAGCAHVINCVTRYEHLESAITQEVTVEAIKAARLAAHIADLSRNINEAKLRDVFITNKRVKEHSCIANGNTCARCSTVCPLNLTSND